MKPDLIIEIGIDPIDRLYIKPEKETYPMIYREGVEVHWDAKGQFLYSPKPREWTYLDWFTHILKAADPYCDALALSDKTIWKNIPDGLRSDIEHWMRTRKPKVEPGTGGNAI